MGKHHTAAFVGGMEAGGAKIVCAVGRGPRDIAQSDRRAVFPTGEEPARILPHVIAWLQAHEHQQHEPLQALGIASFGPLDLVRASPRYGSITATPKRGWQQTDLLGPFQRAFAHLPIGFDTDVNAAALGERRWGAVRGVSDFVYITLGTGIGAGGWCRDTCFTGSCTRRWDTCDSHESRRTSSPAGARSTATAGRDYVLVPPYGHGRA
jgi:fructokinase